MRNGDARENTRIPRIRVHVGLDALCLKREMIRMHFGDPRRHILVSYVEVAHPAWLLCNKPTSDEEVNQNEGATCSHVKKRLKREVEKAG